jgi:ATP/ADP translocase
LTIPAAAAAAATQVYIEMDADEKKQGKAAVDLVGSQVGAAAVSHAAAAVLLV